MLGIKNRPEPVSSSLTDRVKLVLVILFNHWYHVSHGFGIVRIISFTSQTFPPWYWTFGPGKLQKHTCLKPFLLYAITVR